MEIDTLNINTAGCVALYSLKAVGCNVAIRISDASGRTKRIGAEKKNYRLMFGKYIIKSFCLDTNHPDRASWCSSVRSGKC